MNQNITFIRDFFSERDLFAKHLGIRLVDIGQGNATAEMTLNKHHYNGANLAHGGAIFTLADFAFAVASNSHGTVSLAINASISFIKPGISGILTAHAKEIAKNKKLGTYEVSVTNEEQDIIATFQGTVYRKNEHLTSLLEK